MKTKSQRQLRWSRKDKIFYLLLVIWPILQFIVFYIGVNFKSLLLAFQNIDVFNGTREFTFDNVKNAFDLLTKSKMVRHTELMSLTVYLISLLTGVPLGLLFSYYIAKKKFGAGAFRVMLFLPSIVSSIIMVTIYRYFMDYAIPQILQKRFDIKLISILTNDDIRVSFAAIMFYNVFISFGTSVLMYSNKISASDPAIIEACHLDGATGIKEFWYITLPEVFPTLSTFLIVGIAGIFTNQFNLFSFFGKDSIEDLQTFGYYLYVQTAKAQSESDYPPISALGLLLSVVAIALTYFAKFIIGKLGPSED